MTSGSPQNKARRGVSTKACVQPPTQMEDYIRIHAALGGKVFHRSLREMIDCFGPVHDHRAMQWVVFQSKRNFLPAFSLSSLFRFVYFYFYV